MPITATNPFKGRQYPGEVIVAAVRWYLRYPLAYLHVAELLAERGVFADATYIWRWVKASGPELNKRCPRHLKTTNKSFRIDETCINVKGDELRHSSYSRSASYPTDVARVQLRS
jgi:IS6 family transposase